MSSLDESETFTSCGTTSSATVNAMSLEELIKIGREIKRASHNNPPVAFMINREMEELLKIELPKTYPERHPSFDGPFKLYGIPLVVKEFSFEFAIKRPSFYPSSAFTRQPAKKPLPEPIPYGSSVGVLVTAAVIAVVSFFMFLGSNI